MAAATKCSPQLFRNMSRFHPRTILCKQQHCRHILTRASRPAVYHNCRQYYDPASSYKESELWKIYHETKNWCSEAQKTTPWINPTAVFANNEISLSDIDVYGFDYDYTLANYDNDIHNLIYDLSKEVLINKKKYPRQIRDLPYQPDFAVRGLHFDVSKGLLMKIDAFHHIQLGTVYRGLNPLSDDEVKELYHGTHIPLSLMNSFYGSGGHMRQMMDLFSIPEMTLLANVIQYFIEKNIPYDPEYLFFDINDAVKSIHYSGAMHQTVQNNIEQYLEKCKNIPEFLNRLVNCKRKIFLITNSSYNFVEKGMNYIVGADWMDLFDIVVTQARKPSFYSENKRRPFRHFDRYHRVPQWTKVDKFEKGQIYLEGNLELFHKMTGWVGSSVMYFGDHVYSDLADPSLRSGWRTGAIIPELESEINTMNSDVYKESLTWLVALQNLIETMQANQSPDCQAVIQEWLNERNKLRILTKEVFNPRFGSLFRTYHNPTYFSRRLSRFADFYTSDIINLLNYSTDHTFYPRRAALPHENYYHAGMSYHNPELL
ncbi:5'-nucleotidase domain-containing protein 3-like [Saccoglossus kowalevskii]|uniref:5'-nucleotidase domain-containing protein 3-like n=1 Tax=Saccoglossus kowalevskii TaxID=10224 RepID=A0ABM0GW43_SACKO|nr:PREDICTED: 5'-nucleotidase domain-containing protein 3-like [Saccoglossus kowalevskii]